ncbi:efflux RND transporter periplasmic adaptor subunit [Ohtaekwangia koreensis]|uniref:Multidrug efflux pump subunit AcrA (Membrane-fusion protein) n=1 Tax=Ohtaekwangia koreensis TaxID=688867 RepID=A0A1T5K278_9BACT|nr:efflux RND transporter periplasmic adaptor subunit [Ohtaekwangia koreensis]SKC57704.1 Multidrug efflux pump subunit AcrA (membrane-fusion protein) [Ohtaekwangia koreensis]
MKKKLLIGGGALAVLLVVFFIVRGNKASETADVMTSVKRGPFKIEIETTGELEAKNSVKILGPSQLRDFRIWNVTIQSIIDEGTVVKKGDWVATLDRSEFQNRFNEKQIELEKANSKFVQTQLDTTLQMRQSRDELINLRYGKDEKQIVLDQSKFEPPATIKQNQIDLEKAIRAYDQATENNKIKKKQNIEKMREVSAELRKVQNEFTSMTKVMESFNVIAPEDGMVIYEKGWDGKPIKGGSQINMWEPTVATLPDLTKMMSKTYVNEVDVRKVKAGQDVSIGLDAYPDKKLTGKVIRVANVGEQRPNSDAKVFEVAVEINGTDPTLRPSMTTSNRIIASVIDSAMFVPLECLHSQADTITYVFKKEGINTVKQEVVVGQTNSNDVVILKGLVEDDRVYLSIPAGSENDEISLLKEMNGKRKKKEEEEKPAEPAKKLPTASSN